MYTLAIDTSSKSGAAALLRDADVVAERVLDPRMGSARTLAPAIAELLADQQLQLSQLKLIAVSTGPGSFTGLRVGITTAKALAFAVGCDLVGVDTLDAIAAQVDLTVAGESLHAVIDAQRRELFLARYERRTTSGAVGGWLRVGQTSIIPAEQWLGELSPGIIVTGPALPRLVGRLPAQVIASPGECWTPTASTIGRLGLVAWRAGRRDDLFQLLPTYLRPSYAEEKTK